MAVRTLYNYFRGLFGDDSTVEADLRAAFLDFTVTAHKDAADAAANTATARHCIWRNDTGNDVEVVGASFLPGAAAAAHATNYATLTLDKEDSAAGGATAIATANTSTGTGAAMVADTDWDLTLTAANAVVADGYSLHITIAKAAAGVAVPEGCWLVQCRKRG